ncbi:MULTISPECIES: CopM family metallochaperone [unclassified Psychrobacter]|uniref:CopM family metallochaperone n=1 Tax=unclassified Psychrobacter TaxID=196806 RepID=UPI003FB6760B
MIASHRFVLLATSISTALILSACQPKTENSEASLDEETISPVTDMAETPEENDANDLSEDEDTIDESQMTDELRDYTRAMTRMHDEMMIGMSYNDPDTAFAKAMLGHHRGAIEMAKIQLKYGSDEEIRQLAQDIIDNQQVEIAILNKWLASHPDTVKPKPNTEAMQEAYARSMDVLNGDMVLGIADPVPDMAFARGMLPHHISAVEMAKIQLEYGTNEEMRQLAKDIIDAQQAEIQLMQNWIAALEVINNEPKANNSAIDDDTNSTDNDEVQIEQPVN